LLDKDPPNLQGFISKLNNPKEEARVRLVVLTTHGLFFSDVIDAIGLALNVDPRFSHRFADGKTSYDNLVPPLYFRKSPWILKFQPI